MWGVCGLSLSEGFECGRGDEGVGEGGGDGGGLYWWW